jgi:hypothetical protein
MWAGEGYNWLQVFTGDPLGPDMRRKAVAIEPMTCPPNAFVTADDLLVLQPGDGDAMFSPDPVKQLVQVRAFVSAPRQQGSPPD